MCAAFHNQSPLLLTMSGWDHFALFIKCKKHAFPKSDFRSDSYWPIYANFWIRYPPPRGGLLPLPYMEYMQMILLSPHLQRTHVSLTIKRIMM